ncbi:MAG: hypothetical protein HRU76_11115 [Phycisphaeraceae bacterium]|nr:MAG: hypothetical protein HRU76_11115 [Phycisphaeraceae bacterium]
MGDYRILYTIEPHRVVVLYVRHGARRRLRRKERRDPPV